MGTKRLVTTAFGVLAKTTKIHSRVYDVSCEKVNIYTVITLGLRFPASDGAENEMKLGGKGGKGKRRQKNNSLSSSMEVVKEGECQDNSFTFSMLVVCKKNDIMMIRNHSSLLNF